MGSSSRIDAATEQQEQPRRPRNQGSSREPRRLWAVGYLRRSTDRQEQSIPDQRRAIERYADEHGIGLRRFYVDDGISGTSTSGRKSFQEMMDEARSTGRDFDLVIVYDVKRFGRVDNDEAGYYRHLLKQSGVEVRYASEGFTGDGTDDLLRPVKQWQARQESKDLAKVVIRGLFSKATIAGLDGPRQSNADGGDRRAAKREPNQSKAVGGGSGGGWMGGAPPFGFDLRYESQSGEFIFTVRYERDGSKTLLDAKGEKTRSLQRGETVAVSKRDRCHLVPSSPERVKVARDIFRQYVELQRGYKAVADALNQAGVETARGQEWSERYGGLWSAATIRAILVNPAYAGDLVWNRRTDGRFFRIKADGRAVERAGVHSRRLEPNDESDWIVQPDAHPAIIARRVWELAQQRLKASRMAFEAALKGDSEGERGFKGGLGVLPQGRKHQFLLSGILTCGCCGNRYQGHGNPTGHKKPEGKPWPKVWTYACGGYIRRGRSTCTRGAVSQSKLDKLLCEAVAGYYQRYAGATGRRLLSASIRSMISTEGDDLAAKQAKAQQRISAVDSTVRNLVDSLTPANREIVDKRLSELSRERARLERDIESLRSLSIPARDLERLIAECSEFAGSMGAVMEHGDLAAKRALLGRCVSKAVLERTDDGRVGTLKLTLRILPMIARGPAGSALHELVVSVPAK